MPFIRIDMIEGRTPDAINVLLDAAHRAVVAAFKVPQRDWIRIPFELRRSKDSTGKPDPHHCG